MKQALLRKILWTVVIVCFSSAYVVSFEDGEVPVTISNGTRHYLHMLINNQPYLYVAPGGSASLGVMWSTVHVEVLYSPGQGISGRAVRDLTSVTTTTYSGGESRSCHNNSKNDCSVNHSDTRTSQTTRSPMSWRVVPQELSTDSSSIPD
jgi:hypothetical protein